MTELTGNNQIADVASGSDTRIRLDPEARIWINGRPYVVVTLDETTNVLRRVDLPRVFARFTDADLRKLIARGRLIQDYGALSPFERSLRYNPEVTFWHLDPDVADSVIFRMYFCFGLLELDRKGKLPRGDASMEVAISQIYERWMRRISKWEGSCRRLPTNKCPKPRTVRDWLRKFEASDFEPMALCPQQHKRIIWSR
ncbi:hypothetical protein SIAM614_15557 [Stappia aggregata IAM 12614]|uniref:Uncharacterized protein n=1 Tax=Roseibium aggregatum (strain ATCC 25650 / DSM 13394 / JCM 20685 / NBRC 16684 / NCIMB 2208 / IAM 12614 / B1) TaxID=384765 RepID=A0NW58_ROSAI|nr:hypothetical protein [Roseibium aggregatum]EAV42774.1 hypothetical protein SIAM614_15557 [Stappia aggregata IAM 12614] [Roseibium aggregatum IAM 12614]